MRLTKTAITLATATALAAPGALALVAPTTAAAGTATVKIGRTSAGKILETGSGATLYLFSKDSRNHSACAAISGCTSVWPALTVKGKPTAGAGVKASLLGTITVHGHRQVTYAGHPLYLYAAGSGTGETDYLGFGSFGGHWDGLTAGGAAVS